MDDCEMYGRKHRFQFKYAVDNFLVGELWFKCRRCATRVMVDRFWFYQALMTPKADNSWR